MDLFSAPVLPAYPALLCMPIANRRRRIGETITLVSAVRLDGAIAPMMLPSSINGDSFAGYVEQFLVRELNGVATSLLWTTCHLTRASA